mgnify:CR=1 FL=1
MKTTLCNVGYSMRPLWLWVLLIFPFSCQQYNPQPQSLDPQIQQSELQDVFSTSQCVTDSWSSTCGLLKGKASLVKVEVRTRQGSFCEGNYNIYFAKQDGQNVTTLGTNVGLRNGTLSFQKMYTPPTSLPSGNYEYRVVRQGDGHTIKLYTLVRNEDEQISHLGVNDFAQSWVNLTGGESFALRWLVSYIKGLYAATLHRASDDAILASYTTPYQGVMRNTFPEIGADTECYFMVGGVKSKHFILHQTPDLGLFDCNGSGKVCAVYQACRQNCKKFTDLVERNAFYVEWDDTAISSPTVSIYLKRGSRTHARVEDVANTGVFNQFGLSFPRVTANTSGFYIEVVSGNQSITSRTFTVEDD